MSTLRLTQGTALLLMAVWILALAPLPASGSDARESHSGAAAQEGAAKEQHVRPFNAVAAGGNDFAYRFYARLLEGEDAEQNLFVSPYSVVRALGLAYPGAKGSTAEEFGRVLNNELEMERFLEGTAQLEQHLTREPRQPRGVQNWEPPRLHIANSAWVERTFPLKQSYLDRLNEHFEMPARTVNFKEESEEVRTEINEWIAEQTEEMITDLLSSNDVTPLTRFILVNALYFEAEWQNTFSERATHDATFTKLDGEEIEVRMMRNDKRVFHTSGEDYLLVEVPYRDTGVAMTIVLPEEGKFAEVRERFAQGELAESLSALEREFTRLRMPRFEMRTQVRLREHLQAMGLREAFTQGADFSGLVDTEASEETFFLGSVIHEAVVEVNEQGTRAAAATAMGGFGGRPPEPELEITIDRPFIVMLRDTVSGAILFVGHVLEPKVEEQD